MHIHVSISGSFNPPSLPIKKLINTWRVLSYPVVIGCTRQLWALLCDYEEKQAHLILLERKPDFAAYECLSNSLDQDLARKMPGLIWIQTF